ncbi:hypothetical protein VRRI112168_03425 [Vreelandella rituensis]|uniref:Plasmid recombination enzyme n=1 Tax=Vreelandella rituensis TaxID=2282306 RepID=A0A368U9T3_9GAMM|nr:hypothetical protein [Halomonas rituensis]RCV93704.1 hypothetical protein DU506_00695 [Halomonas rituensis]
MPTYQFIRIQGYPRGDGRKKGTLGSVTAEGRRAPSHSRHIEGEADIKVIPVRQRWKSILEYQKWIENTMGASVSVMNFKGRKVHRGVRSDAIALGTIIISLPTLAGDTSRKLIDTFTQESIAWVENYLAEKQMALDYCIQHFDEKYPHLHFWFTPGDDMLSRKEWNVGAVANPPLPDKDALRKTYFREVGHKYVDELEKPPTERIPRQHSRAIAAKNRLPPGEPGLGETNKAMGIPFKKKQPATADKETSPSVEQDPLVQGIIRRMIGTALERKSLIARMSQDEIIDMMLARAIQDQAVIDKLAREMKEDARKGEGKPDQRKKDDAPDPTVTQPRQDRLDSYVNNSATNQPKDSLVRNSSRGDTRPESPLDTLGKLRRTPKPPTPEQ